MMGVLDDVSEPEISQENQDHMLSICFIITVFTTLKVGGLWSPVKSHN